MATTQTTNTRDEAPAGGEGATAMAFATNGHFDAKRLIAALKTLKRGDFSVRLPVDETVVGAAISEAFNDLADLLENDTRETARIAMVVGKEGRITQRANIGAAAGGVGGPNRIDQHPHRRPGPAYRGGRARHRRRREGRPLAAHPPGARGDAAERRVPPHWHNR
jgi:hypothetical protein